MPSCPETRSKPVSVVRQAKACVFVVTETPHLQSVSPEECVGKQSSEVHVFTHTSPATNTMHASHYNHVCAIQGKWTLDSDLDWTHGLDSGLVFGPPFS